jgi:hypothetical protein
VRRRSALRLDGRHHRREAALLDARREVPVVTLWPDGPRQEHAGAATAHPLADVSTAAVASGGHYHGPRGRRGDHHDGRVHCHAPGRWREHGLRRGGVADDCAAAGRLLSDAHGRPAGWLRLPGRHGLGWRRDRAEVHRRGRPHPRERDAHAPVGRWAHHMARHVCAVPAHD